MKSVPPNEIALLRALEKDRTAIVLLIMFRLGRPVGESELKEILGVTPKTARGKLQKLAGIGLITRTHRYEGWTLTQGGRQLALTGPERLLEDPRGERPVTGYRSSPTTTAFKESLSLKDSAAAAETTGNPLPVGVDPQVQEILLEFGIGPPTCDQLARDPEITPEYARAHLANGRRRGEPLGLVIHRLRSHDPAPADPDAPERYTAGRFAEFIEH